jgi:hypothetical protein
MRGYFPDSVLLPCLGKFFGYHAFYEPIFGH